MVEDKNLEEKFEPKYKTIYLSDNPKKYSPIHINSYDKERHIPLSDAYDLIESQGDFYLSKEKLKNVIEKDEITVYEFNEKRYLDRLDIGRIYHNIPEKKEGLTIERYFTKSGEDPFDSVKYKIENLEINDFKTGEVIFKMNDVEIPEWMDNTSAKIVAQKYFFNPSKQEWKDKMKEKIGSEHEFSLKHLNKRVADFFTTEGDKLGYFKSEEDRENFRNELYFLQINGVGAFNSPTQFNAGLFNSYGITGSSGINYYKNPSTGKIEKVLNGEYIHPQLHACFIKGPNDNLESIANNVIDEIAIFASGSGIGHNIGKLRGDGEKLSGGGKASGSMSFFKIYDSIAGTIKSGGKTRRAARMTTERYTHPDIMKFITAKVNEDKKALTLMQNGFSSGMDGEAYTTVAYQNTNLSVRLDDTFFEILKSGGEVQTYNVGDGKPDKKISADRMLKEIAFGSWRIGDPAVQYESKIQEMHTGKNSGRQNSTNPCSEYLYLDDSSCSLFSLRNTYFMKEDGNIDIEEYRKAFRIFTIAQNIANKAASYPVKEIAQISPEFETIGGGYADLGAFLMRNGIPYDSDKGRAITGALTALMTGTVYETSIEIAKAIGTFTHYEFNKKPMLEVMKKHKKSLDDILWNEVGDEKLKEATYKSWDNVLEKGEKYGFSNAQATVLAPTGTISYLMGCSTTGIEPAFSLSTKKTLAGGGNIIIENKDVESGLNSLGYKDLEIIDILKFIDKHNTVINAPHLMPKHYSVFDTANADGNIHGIGTINFQGHLKMVAAAQPFISGAISKTNNLPKNAKVKDFYDGYLLGRDLGLKAIAVFRDKSKPISVLGNNELTKKLKRGEKEELPFSGDGFRQEIKIDGTPFLINIGEYSDGRPGEIVINSYTSDSTLGAMLRLAGIGASSALKRGSSLEDALKGWIGHGFEPRGFVTIETPEGKIIPHPYIKQVSSPLDFVAKLALLHYKGEKELATEPDKVNIKNLRGFTHGAFRTYKRMKVDEWNIEDVLNDSETGGFVEDSGDNLSEGRANGNGNGKRNSNGKMCNTCGNVMCQSGPNCFECKTCGDKVGGCGA